MKSAPKRGSKAGAKKPKKGKTSSRPSRSASQAAAAQSSPQLLPITRKAPARSGLRVRTEVRAAVTPAASEIPAASEGPRTAVARCQQLYATSHTRDASGRIQLDAARLAQALAEAGIGVRAEQELYSLALLAAADGHAALFEEDVIAAIAKAS